jgi:hypothetical protein
MLDRCTVCTEHTMLRNCFGCTGSANVPQAKKLFLMHLIELLGDETQVEARFGPFGDSANLDTRYVHGLRRTYHRSRNHFRFTQR